MTTKRTKIEDKWWRMREEFHKVEMQMQKEAGTLAIKAELSTLVIGKTPLEWYYFIKEIREESGKAIPKGRRTISKSRKVEFDGDDRSLEGWSKIILGR